MFDVFVDGATGTSPGAVRDLAAAMAARYGLAAVDLRGRLMRGPFRVKAGVDRRTADAYLRDLVALGARARIEPTGGGALDGGPGYSSLPARPASRPSGASLPPPSRPSAASLPPALGRPTRSSLPPQPAARPSGSALATTRILDAAAGAIPTALGALDRSGQLSLATLDDEPAQSSASDGTLPASMGPAAPRPERPARSRNEPLDPFAPPELAEAEPVLELADDEIAHRVRRQAASRPPAAATAPPTQRTAAAQERHGAMPSRPPEGRTRASLPPPLPAVAPASRPGLPMSWGGAQDSGSAIVPSEAQRASGAAVSAGAGAMSPGSSTSPGGDAQRPSGASMSPDAGAMSYPGSSIAGGGDAQRAVRASMSPGAMSYPGSSMASRDASWMAGGGDAMRPAPGGGAVAVLVDRIPALASARVRLAAGVVLAIALGFVPAHLAAGMRERSAYAAIDRTVASIQSAAATPEAYAALDAFRAEQLDAKRSARRSIIATAMVIWAAAGGALAYAWFRRVPWGPRR